MNNYSPSPRFEQDLRAILAQPGMRPEFAAQLRQRLATAAKVRPVAQRPKFNRAWATALIALTLLIATVLALGPQRVLAQVLEWLRYVPGIGFVDSEGGLRVLAEPVSQTIDGITISIEEGLIDSEFTWLTFYFDGIRAEQKPTSENDPGCFATPQILLPDGSSLSIIGGTGGGGPTWMREEFNYLALPLDVNDVRVIIPCVPEVLSGAGPENMEFAIRFVPAPEDFEALPVQPVPTATAPAEAQPHDMQLIVDEYVELEDAYLFRGRFSWEGSPFPNAELWDFQLTLTDAVGNKLPIELSFDQPYSEPLDPFLTWTALTRDKNINGPITFSLAEIAVRKFLELSETNSFEFEITAPLESGRVFPLNETIELEGSPVVVSQIKYDYKGDDSQWLFLTLHKDPEILSYVNFLDTYPGNGSGAGGGPLDQEESIVGIGYDQLPVGAHKFWVDNYFLRLQGPWTAQVELPALDPGLPTPTAAPAACLNGEIWQDLLANPASQLPPALANARLLVQGPSSDGALFPTLHITAANGRQVVEIGPGWRPDLSPNGSRVVYEYQDVFLFDVAGEQTTLLFEDDLIYNPRWSPDGSRLAYIRATDGVYTVDTNGRQPQRVPGSNADTIVIQGWLPDGENLVVSQLTGTGAQAQLLNTASGEVTPLFLMDNFKNGLGLLSPDGRKIAFLSEVFGNFAGGLYVAQRDGSSRRLVAESGPQPFFNIGAWSPDGEWLIVNVYDAMAFEPTPQHPLAINLQTCETVVLGELLGEVIDWN